MNQISGKIFEGDELAATIDGHWVQKPFSSRFSGVVFQILGYERDSLIKNFFFF